MAKIAEIIKYEGDNTTFVWKHPSEDFNYLKFARGLDPLLHLAEDPELLIKNGLLAA